MATAFVLVHGAWHSGWCWTPVVEALADRGAHGVAVDLPSEDPSAGLAEYTAAVVAVIDGLAAEEVVVVGHSMGGMTIPLVTMRRPVAGLIYVAALTPEPGRSMGDLIDASTFGPRWPEYREAQIAHADGSSEWRREEAIDAFYHDCVPVLADVAWGHLRVQQWKAAQDRSPLTAIPDVPARYVVTEQDRVLSPAWQRNVAAPRVTATVVTLDCGHAPMLAKPRELVDLLLAPLT
jgi:pimeloyl-ACP methyl ester carboxylesterase